MTETEFMWLPWRHDVPEGWTVCEDQHLSHHHYWSRLIMREVAEPNLLPETESGA